MRYHECLSINAYITHSLTLPEVQKITEHWRVDPQMITDMLTEYFREQGIFKVSGAADAILIQNVTYFLRNSPELQKIVSRSMQDELRRKRTEHAD